MTKVDFYILKNAQNESRSRELFVCKLIDKAFSLGNKVFVRAANEQQAMRLNDHLWTFRQNSFIPHELASSVDADISCPVIISHESEPGNDHDVLVNLCAEIPQYFSKFERVAEIVDDSNRDQARERFSWYRDRGYALQHHDIPL